MNPPVLSKRKVRDLRKDLLQRRFAVPKLQRNFVWDGRRAASLLDSIYKHMPIGSLFFWDVPRVSAHLIRQTADVLPLFDDRNPTISFVIDGQQRLSVIHQAFEGEQRENDMGRIIDFARLCFVVDPPSDTVSQARVVYRKPAGSDFVALKDVLAADWGLRVRSHPQWVRKRLEDCRQRLLHYPVPVVTVPRATLEEIGEIFIRVNSQGMRISSADRAIALMGALDVRAMAEQVRRRVRERLFDLKGIEPILMGFNLVAESPSLGADPPKLAQLARRWSKRLQDDESAKKEFQKRWDRCQRAFLKAVDYIHHAFPVHDEPYLPSANMLATLSVFFFFQGKRPNRYQAREIRKWFWATGVAQRYTGRGYHRNIVADATFFEDLASGKQKPFVFKDYLDPVLDLRAAEYGARSARTRAFFCLLAKQRPRYLGTGERIPLDGKIVSRANRRHRHHIFPQAQMRRHFAARAYNSLCNICFLVSEDNVAIGMKQPRAYLADYRDRGPATFRRTMESHLIPVDSRSGIWDDNIVRGFKTFREKRLDLIRGAFEREAGIRLFRRD